jgi:hemerythrin-like domain-containing protein
MEQLTTNLAADLIRIHKVITRGLNVGLVKGREYSQSGFPQPQALVGYSSYTHSLASVLDSHHMGEDLIAFPKFRLVISSAPYAKLVYDHLQIETLLAPLPPIIAALPDDAHKGLESIVDTLRKISEIWEPHIQLEERYFSEAAINAVIAPEDQRRISEAAGKYSQEHSGPPYWVIPFVLYNLERDERAIMASTFPAMIMDELVPKVWAEQWSPMKPLLLD